ncbi:hypothetical protein [Nocardia nova]|uniref:hypothetical protein n=1 Tax=Nocardia nova TaxID=37330 RepID=UPI0011B09609|nr:hypothetical protein [Nocardia nova]
MTQVSARNRSAVTASGSRSESQADDIDIAAARNDSVRCRAEIRCGGTGVRPAPVNGPCQTRDLNRNLDIGEFGGRGFFRLVLIDSQAGEAHAARPR